MQISVISSSQRSDSQSLRVSRYIAERIESVGSQAEVHDLHALALTTDIEQAWDSHAAQPVVDRLQACDGAVFVTPEWAGMPSPALLNLLLHIGESLAHKPVLLVGVSAGRGGAYPIAALRSIGYKNTKYVMIPEHLIFRSVNDLLHEGEPSGKEDLFMRRRTDHAVAELLIYAKGLASIRAELPETPREFRFGM
ncbi:MAG: NAD(P)H-dependent oxidoreductase [Acidimicrobiales bacterium]|nr:NAD(P)H-dependent oxidoreductase [Acidimicrobiales bacterium]